MNTESIYTKLPGVKIDMTDPFSDGACEIEFGHDATIALFHHNRDRVMQVCLDILSDSGFDGKK